MEPLPEVRPSEEDWRSEDEEDEDEDDEDDEEDDEVEDEVDVDVDELSLLEPELLSAVLLLVVVPLPLLAVVSASDCIVPTRANTPADAASVIAAARAAVRLVPLRTAAAAPRCSLSVMTDPLLRDCLSRITFGYRPERSL
ncbi:hypothetical protein ABZ372_45170 [Streptomyces sp. NPDC005921]|uniref:hypothetical protein n=1 Tax=Streptomyces sp. NPDC005827 TaxID=3157070 RepID=UPI0033EA9DB2